ncbi:MAG: hypothetical protein ACOCQP_03490, partial [Lentisphaeria bacterium]
MRSDFKKLLRLAEEWEFIMLGIVTGLLIILLVAVVFQQPPDDSIASSRRQVDLDTSRINPDGAYTFLNEREEDADLSSPHALESELDIYDDTREKTKVEARKKKKEDEKK